MRLTRRSFAAAIGAVPTAALLVGRAAAAEVHEVTLGDAKAPVTIIEYFSLTCPHCAHFATNTLPDLKKQYIDTGKVKLVLRDFPLDQIALKAAVIAHCAGDDHYPAFVEEMFKTQGNWEQASDPVASLKELGRLGGLTDAAGRRLPRGQVDGGRGPAVAPRRPEHLPGRIHAHLHRERQEVSGRSRHPGIRHDHRSAPQIGPPSKPGSAAAGRVLWSAPGSTCCGSAIAVHKTSCQWLQVLLGPCRPADRGGADGNRRPERLRQVQHRRGPALGHGRELGPRIARDRDGRRHLRGLGLPRSLRPGRGRAEAHRARSRPLRPRRRGGDRDRPADRSRRRVRLPHQRPRGPRPRHPDPLRRRRRRQPQRRRREPGADRLHRGRAPRGPPAPARGGGRHRRPARAASRGRDQARAHRGQSHPRGRPAGPPGRAGREPQEAGARGGALQAGLRRPARDRGPAPQAAARSGARGGRSRGPERGGSGTRIGRCDDAAGGGAGRPPEAGPGRRAGAGGAGGGDHRGRPPRGARGRRDGGGEAPPGRARRHPAPVRRGVRRDRTGDSARGRSRGPAGQLDQGERGAHRRARAAGLGSRGRSWGRGPGDGGARGARAGSGGAWPGRGRGGGMRRRGQGPARAAGAAARRGSAGPCRDCRGDLRARASRRDRGARAVPGGAARSRGAACGTGRGDRDAARRRRGAARQARRARDHAPGGGGAPPPRGDAPQGAPGARARARRTPRPRGARPRAGGLPRAGPGADGAGAGIAAGVARSCLPDGLPRAGPRRQRLLGTGGRGGGASQGRCGGAGRRGGGS